MTIGIYNPYSETLGGGEQYMFTFAAYFLKKHCRVIYYSDDPQVREKAEARFGLSLSNLEVRPSVFETGSLKDKVSETRKLDIFLFYSDGSLPTSFAKKNYFVFQFPVPWVLKQSLANRIKLRRSSGVIVNSNFTRRFINKIFSVNATVFYPAISISDYSSHNKQKLILSVGRYTKGMNTKRQDILISAFKSMFDSGIKDWKLVLAGGVLNTDRDQIELMKKQMIGYPIILESNISRDKLLQLYNAAAIYWHAAGYQIDEEKNPEKVEHFGITTVEAMASGAVPLVYPAGGQKEIVINGRSGFHWHTKEELVETTVKLLQNDKLRTAMQPGIFERAKEFDRSAFFAEAETFFHI